MKFRQNKIKREHSIINGGLEWLESLAALPEVSDIIPGVIKAHNTPGQSITFQYDTTTGCKLLMRSGGAVQEVFVVSERPEAVREWLGRRTSGFEALSPKARSQKGTGREAGRTAEESMDDYFPLTSRAKEEQAWQEELVRLEKLEKQTQRPPSASETNRELPGSKPPDKKPPSQDPCPMEMGISQEYRLVAIDPGLRDAYVDSLAYRADLDKPTLEERLAEEKGQAFPLLKGNSKGRQFPKLPSDEGPKK